MTKMTQMKMTEMTQIKMTQGTPKGPPRDAQRTPKAHKRPPKGPPKAPQRPPKGCLGSTCFKVYSGNFPKSKENKALRT